MDYGAHLPLIGFDQRPFSLDRLLEYTRVAQGLGFKAIAANDHLVFARPWLDGPTALAAIVSHARDMDLMTTVALPVVRGPAPLAKTLAAIDILSGGRLIVGVGPGSSSQDYAVVGVAFEERWKRLDEAVQAMRAWWGKEVPPFHGSFYSTAGIEMRPHPTQQPGPPIWIGSWGSTAGLRRTARLGDGWLASAYNATPALFTEAWGKLREHLVSAGKDPDSFPNALATMILFVTEDGAEAERMVRDVLAPALNRPWEELKQRVMVGPAQECAEKLAAYADAGLQRLFLWPLADEVHQLELFRERVAPI
ncbi:MAG: LLM class flavin-dependent oxidoreductase [Chloroflexi bacterium]|nr:LLM class flavin-dependent oxidoreductase [Chloroflexota bacterium]